mmetsp:Transcript_41336/g.107019  ORF Transcript_41336/g.107019 Transcript_41336/m.107019 type:complete len:466 (+) Transcript_41336:480-1877(+)
MCGHMMKTTWLLMQIWSSIFRFSVSTSNTKKKTEKSLAEMELDQNLALDLSRIEEKGENLVPLFGPGFTGIENIGNSCYLASTMQVLFSIDSFAQQFGSEADVKRMYQSIQDPFDDATYQLTRLCVGLRSGRYAVRSRPAEGASAEEVQSAQNSQDGILPRLFKNCIGRNHEEFSSGRQQDAAEYYQHVLDIVKREAKKRGIVDPSSVLRFTVVDRLQDIASGMVRYSEKEENCLSVSIPLDRAINKAEVEAFKVMEAEKTAKGEKVNSDEIVRPRIPLADCLAATFGDSIVDDFKSPITGQTGHAQVSMKMGTFPNMLVLQMRRFYFSETWQPKKLDCEVEVPDELTIEAYRGSAQLKEGEVALPDGPQVQADAGVVAAIVDMGFPPNQAQKAALKTNNSGVEAAMNWLMEHMGDPGTAHCRSGPCYVHTALTTGLLQISTTPSSSLQVGAARRAAPTLRWLRW